MAASTISRCALSVVTSSSRGAAESEMSVTAFRSVNFCEAASAVVLPGAIARDGLGVRSGCAVRACSSLHDRKASQQSGNCPAIRTAASSSEPGGGAAWPARGLENPSLSPVSPVSLGDAHVWGKHRACF